jgi:hypothetical protein
MIKATQYRITHTERWPKQMPPRAITCASSTRLERCVPALFLLAIYIENLRIAEGRASVLAVVAGLVIGAVAALWLRVSDLLIRRWRST